MTQFGHRVRHGSKPDRHSPLLAVARVDKRAVGGVYSSSLDNQRNGPPRPIAFTSRCC